MIKPINSGKLTGKIHRVIYFVVDIREWAAAGKSRMKITGLEATWNIFQKNKFKDGLVKLS